MSHLLASGNNSYFANAVSVKGVKLKSLASIEIVGHLSDLVEVVRVDDLARVLVNSYNLATHACQCARRVRAQLQGVKSLFLSIFLIFVEEGKVGERLSQAGLAAVDRLDFSEA